jgi:hypothetical protein
VVLAQTGSNSGAVWLYAGLAGGNLATDLRGKTRGNRPLASETTITDGAWHHIGLAWDGSNRMLYVDGIEVAKDAHDSLAPPAAASTSGPAAPSHPATSGPA